jgi:hypothetical protein
MDISNKIELDKKVHYNETIGEVEFLLEIQEISGKFVAENYVNELIKKFEKMNIEYEFNLVPSDEEIEIEKMIGGNDLTFPYNYFYSLASNIEKIVSNKETNIKTKLENDRIIYNLFTKEESKQKDEEYIKHQENKEEETSLDKIETDNKKKSSLVLPKHYTGLIKIHLRIYYDEINKTNKLVGRIYDLNNWLLTKSEE